MSHDEKCLAIILTLVVVPVTFVCSMLIFAAHGGVQL